MKPPLAAAPLEPLMCVFCGDDMDCHSATPEVWGCARCRALGWMDSTTGVYEFRQSAFDDRGPRLED